MTEPKEGPRKLPEFIILDDDRAQGEAPPHGFPKFKEPPVKEPSWRMRILFFLISLLATMWTFGAFFFTLCSIVLTLITFNSVKFFRNLVKLYWNWTKGGDCCGAGIFHFSV